MANGVDGTTSSRPTSVGSVRISKFRLHLVPFRGAVGLAIFATIVAAMADACFPLLLVLLSLGGRGIWMMNDIQLIGQIGLSRKRRTGDPNDRCLLLCHNITKG